MKKGLGLQANISSFNTTLPQTKHLNFFMSTNPVGYANGGAVRRGVPSSNMNVTQGFLPMALGFDNGGDVSFYDLVTRVIGNYLAKQSGKSPEDPEIISAAENLQQTNPDAVRVIMESEYGSGVSAGPYDSGFPIGGEPKLPTETATDIGEMRIPEDFGRKPLPSNIDIGEMRIPENFPEEPGLLDKAKEIGGGFLDSAVDLGTSIVDQFKTDDEQAPIRQTGGDASVMEEIMKAREDAPQVKEDDVKKSEETPVDVKSATVTDGGIADLNQGDAMGEAASALASSTLSKEEEKDVNEKIKGALNVDDKKDAPMASP